MLLFKRLVSIALQKILLGGPPHTDLKNSLGLYFAVKPEVLDFIFYFVMKTARLGHQHFLIITDRSAVQLLSKGSTLLCQLFYLIPQPHGLKDA